MENIEQMRARHDAEIAELRRNCKHKKVSNWMDYMWAPGHFGGQVKVCEFCGKTIESVPPITIPSRTTYT